MRNLVSVFILCTTLFSASCSNVTSPTSAPPSAAYTAALLEGTWTVVFVQPAGQARLDRPAAATYTLTFADGRLSTRVDCNSCGGSFVVDGSTITVGPSLACTRAACPTASFEVAYTGLLDGASQMALSGSQLTLTSTRGVVQLTRP